MSTLQLELEVCELLVRKFLMLPTEDEYRFAQNNLDFAVQYKVMDILEMMVKMYCHKWSKAMTILYEWHNLRRMCFTLQQYDWSVTIREQPVTHQIHSSTTIYVDYHTLLGAGIEGGSRRGSRWDGGIILWGDDVNATFINRIIAPCLKEVYR